MPYGSNDTQVSDAQADTSRASVTPVPVRHGAFAWLFGTNAAVLLGMFAIIGAATAAPTASNASPNAATESSAGQRAPAAMSPKANGSPTNAANGMEANTGAAASPKAHDGVISVQPDGGGSKAGAAAMSGNGAGGVADQSD